MNEDIKNLIAGYDNEVQKIHSEIAHLKEVIKTKENDIKRFSDVANELKRLK